MERKRDVWFYIGFVILALYAVFLIYPLFSLLGKSIVDPITGSLTMEHFSKFFERKYHYSAIFNSMKVTVLVTGFTLLLATPLAYFLTTVKIKFSSAVEILILISSLSPPFIGAYSWILLLGRNGVITNFFKNFGIITPDIYGLPGIVLVLTLQLLPLMYMYISGALKSVDMSLIEASESLGSSEFKKVTSVLLPLILPTMLAGSLMVFMRALADFGTPMLIGEGFRTVPVLIYSEFMGELGTDDNFAAAISVMVVIFATTIFLIQSYITKKKAYSMETITPIQPQKETGFKNIISHIFVYAYVIIALAPQLYVIYTSFLKTSGKLFVKGYSLDSYRVAFDKVGSSITATLYMALITLVIIIIIAVLISYITVRRKGTLATTIDTVSMFPYIVPGSILGISLLVTFNKKPILLSGTAAIMILSFVIRRLAYTIRSSSAILHQISETTEEAAISLGASNLKTFFTVTLPAMLPGVVSGAILSWISILTELSTSILLYVSSTRTITVEIYTAVIRGNYGTAAALSTILTVFIIISLVVFYIVSGDKKITV